MRVVVFTTDGLSREDGNVFYSRYLVVEAGSGLSFSETKWFSDDFITQDQDEWTKEVQAAGYKVTEPPQHVVIQPYT